MSGVVWNVVAMQTRDESNSYTYINLHLTDVKSIPFKFTYIHKKVLISIHKEDVYFLESFKLWPVRSCKLKNKKT